VKEGEILTMKVLIVGACLLVSSVAWADPTLIVNGTSGPITVSVGTTVTLVVQDGPATGSDCVTLTSTADSAQQGFAWVNGKTATLPFSIPTATGMYVFRFWQYCSTQIAVSSTLTVQSGAVPILLVNGSSTPITVAAGSTIMVVAGNLAANDSNIVALAHPGDSNTSGQIGQYGWVYLTGNQTTRSGSLTGVTTSFALPTTGMLEVRALHWVSGIGYVTDATSPVVTLAGSPPPQSAPSPASFIAPELPRVYVDTTMPTTTAAVTACGSGCDLQGVINAANLGDVIELQAGATYSGKIQLPNKTNGTGWIIIRSSAWQSLPPPGTRVGPQQVPLMAKITTDPLSSYEPAIVTQQGAHHYRFIGIEVTGADLAATAQQYGLIMIDGTNYDANGVLRVQPTNALTPHHIVIDRCYIHGAPTGEFIRGVLLNGLHIAIVDSYLSNFHSRNGDTQAAIAWNTPGPLKLANNYLEAAGENVMFGGAPSATAGYIPSDIEIRGNFFDKPLSWRAGDPVYAGVPWVVKNLLEFKDGQRALIEGNVFGHHWAAGQSGFFFLITPRGEDNANPWAFTGDITFRYNRIQNSTAGVAVNGTDGQVTQQSNRVLFEHNVFENIGAYVVPGAFNGEFSIIGNAIQNFTLRHNTIFQSSTPLHFTGDSVGAMNGLTLVDNIFGNGGYGIAGDTSMGAAELDAIAPGWVMRKNAIYGPYPNANGVPQSYYPADDYFPASQDALGLVNFAGGDYHLAPWSSYKNTATDGKDVGADIDAVNAATACAISGACGTQ